MSTNTLRSWTPAQAGYQLHTTAVDRRPGRLIRHYVRTRHGVVARTWCGPDLVEIALRRPTAARGTYQGTVRAVAGGWVATLPDGTGSPVRGQYLDAEALLLRVRTGVTARAEYRWWLVD